jgi:ribosome-binding factor A
MSTLRQKKLERIIQEEIGNIIVSKKVKDPRVSTLMGISKVKVSPDTAYAKIYVSGYDPEIKLDTAVKGLNNASGFIQHLLNKHLRIRYTPKLSFYADYSIAEGFILNKKIEELNRE